LQTDGRTLKKRYTLAIDAYLMAKEMFERIKKVIRY